MSSTFFEGLSEDEAPEQRTEGTSSVDGEVLRSRDTRLRMTEKNGISADCVLDEKSNSRPLAFEVVVVGAGPGGLAAASVAAEGGRRVLLVDETPWLGGQIWRGEQARPATRLAGEWLERFARSGASVAGSTGIIACPKPGMLIGEATGGAREIRYEKLVLATGARELFLPFPGWTSPGVMGPGGLLSLAKHGWPVDGKRVVVAGSGPLLLAAADGLAKYGARVAVVAEQAPWTRVVGFGMGLVEQPAKIWQGLGIKRRLRGVPYRTGTWVTKAEGDGGLESVTLTDGRRTWTEACDLLACGFGLVPNLELAVTLGCEIADGHTRVDEWQQTSVPGVYGAGEGIGIGGADAALVDGQIAGLAVSGRNGAAAKLFRRRAAWGRFRRGLKKAFALRPELRQLPTDDTMICRCEDVTLGRLKAFEGWRDAKLHSRCGMGACQGRVCGAAVKFLLGWEAGSVRPPVLPSRVGSLIFQQGKEEKTNL